VVLVIGITKSCSCRVKPKRVGFTGIRDPKVELGVPASHKLVSEGWNEPAATNAPVEDEPVQPVCG
jgi:hypothetical protein